MAMYVVGLVSVACWLGIIAGRYFHLYLAAKYGLARDIGAAAFWVVTVATTGAVAALGWRSHGVWWAIAILTAALVLVVAISAIPWERTFYRSWYAVNRGRFIELARLAGRGELRFVRLVGAPDHARAPAGFRRLSLGADLLLERDHVLFVPADGYHFAGAGFAYVLSGPARPDSSGTCVELNDGWYWVNTHRDYGF